MVGSGGYDWLVVGYGCFEGFCYWTWKFYICGNSLWGAEKEKMDGSLTFLYNMDWQQKSPQQHRH